MLIETATVFIRFAAVFALQLAGSRLFLLRKGGAVASPPLRF
jgi:hypothetical protein